MKHLEVSGAVRHIYIYVIRQLKVKNMVFWSVCSLEDTLASAGNYECLVAHEKNHSLIWQTEISSLLTFRRRNFLLNFSTPCIKM